MGEKKTSRKIPDLSEETPDASSDEALRVSRKKAKRGAVKVKASPRGKSASSVVGRKARGTSATSVLQDMVRVGKGRPLLKTRSSALLRSQMTGRTRKGSKARGGYWQGQMLLASPAIGDSRFERSVIYLCHQGEDGALGLVINKIADKIQFTDVLDHLNIPFSSNFERISVHAGGPVESSRGFVLHSPDKMFAGTIELGDLAMTASSDILKRIAEGKGPKDYVFLLGYAGWGTGQLDKEIERNAWLHLPFDRELVFGENDQDKWASAMQKMGISPHLLSGVSGNA